MTRYVELKVQKDNTGMLFAWPLDGDGAELPDKVLETVEMRHVHTHETPTPPRGESRYLGTAVIENGDLKHFMRGLRVVDARPPVCPNGCGLLEPRTGTETDTECPECGYVRAVLEEPEGSA